MKTNNLNQVELLLRSPDRLKPAPEDVLRQPSMSAAIRLAVSTSGLIHKQIYSPLEIDSGHFSKMMDGKAYFPQDKYSEFFDICQSEAPLYWLANARGYELVRKQTEVEKENEALRQQLEEMHIKLSHFEEFLKVARA